MVWILISIAVLLILLLLVAVFRKKLRKPNYDAFFTAGLILFVAGIITSRHIIWIAGLVLIAVGLHKD